MSSTRVGLALICVSLQSLVVSVAWAGPIGPGDFGADATVLSLDEFALATLISNEFECAAGVAFSGLPPIGAAFSSDVADSFAPSDAISSFLKVIDVALSTSTSSPPNKVIATKYGAGGEILQCDRCGILIRFLDPLPTQVGLWVSDPDLGQEAQFSGPGGLLAKLTVPSVSSNFTFFLGFEDAGGISQVVLRSQPSVGIGFDDLTFAGHLPPSCTSSTDDLAQCRADLGQCEDDLAAAIADPRDEDGDGEPDVTDVCPGTSALTEVDSDGCSLAQFCSGFDATTRNGAKDCERADFSNDEPSMRHSDRDCKVDEGGPGREDDSCAPVP